MLTIPSIPKGYGPWKFRCVGPGPKNIKFIIEEIVKVTLAYEKIKKKDIFIEIFLNSREKMEVLHKQYLKKDGPTDTISLVMDNKSLKEGGPTMLGIIQLCWPVIKEDAQHANKDDMRHLAHIVIHSTLHLLGYDHEKEQDARQMESKEILVLARMGVPNPYLEMKVI